MERQKVALQVLNRVRYKLEGVIPDPGAFPSPDATRYKVDQQVIHLIQQATNQQNLCRMYEGWMPWV